MSGAIATAAVLGGVGLAGSVGGAAISSHAAGSAADKQVNAANHAADLQYQASQNALDFQKQQYGQTQQNIAPWLQTGAGGLGQLGYLLGINPNTSVGQPVSGPQGLPSPTANPTSNAARAVPGMNTLQLGSGSPSLPTSPQSGAVGAVPGASGLSLSGGPKAPVASPALGIPGSNPNAPANPAVGGFGSLLTPYSGHFEAPTGLTEQNDPGYQARLNLGTDAIQRSAAARGGVLTGGTAKALETYGQDYGSNEYNNVYQRALTDFQTGYNQYNNDQSNIFNRLAAIAGVGQSAAGQLSSAGQNASNNVSSNLLGSASNIGQQYNNAGAANASGIYNSGAAWSGALGSAGNNISQLYQLQQLQNMYGGGSGGSGGTWI